MWTGSCTGESIKFIKFGCLSIFHNISQHQAKPVSITANIATYRSLSRSLLCTLVLPLITDAPSKPKPTSDDLWSNSSCPKHQRTTSVISVTSYICTNRVASLKHLRTSANFSVLLTSVASSAWTEKYRNSLTQGPWEEKICWCETCFGPLTNYKSQQIKSFISFTILWLRNDMLYLIFYITTIYQCH